MVIAKILTSSEDIQAEILNKTRQLKKKSTGENRFVGQSFILLSYVVYNLVKGNTS